MLRLVILLFIGHLSCASAVIPRPLDLTPQEGKFQLQSQAAVIGVRELKNESDYLRAQLSIYTGVLHREISVIVAEKTRIPAGIFLSLDLDLPPNHYELMVRPEFVKIRGADREAVFHGIQSFLQLIPANITPGQLRFLPCLTIRDSPTHKIREVKLDVARHLPSVRELQNFLNLLALHKFNRLTLHLCDDQGWRLESNKFPKLHTIGSVRPSTPPYGNRNGSDEIEYAGYYTQEKVRELITFAAARHIEIVPVISLPGQTDAILAAYPEWGTGEKVSVSSTWAPSARLLKPSEEVFTALDALIEEIATLFPAKTIGIHDATPSLQQWGENAAATKELFLSRLKQSAKKNGRSLRLESLSQPLRLDLYQRPESLELAEDFKREAAGGLLTVEDIYHHLPASAVLWSPYLHDYQKLEYMAFPRLAAVAEILWTPKELLDYNQFKKSLSKLQKHYSRRKVNAAKLYESPKRVALYGVTIDTSIGHYLEHWPEAAFDGKKDTYFQSDRGLEKGDYFSLIFPEPINGDVEVATGGSSAEDALLYEGVLEVSPDAENWHPLATFLDGHATVTVPEGTRAIRIRATEKQIEPTLIHEIILSRAPILKKLEETRSIAFHEEAQTELLFRCDHSAHSGFGKKVGLLRDRFFAMWPRVTPFLRVYGFPETPTTITVAFDQKSAPGVISFSSEEFARLSAEEVEGEFVNQLISQIQNYPADAPAWFAEGLNLLIRTREMPDSTWTKNRPAKTKKSQAVTGGWASADFLEWVAEQFEEFTLSQISLSCRRGYDERRWEALTGLAFPDLVREYQK